MARVIINGTRFTPFSFDEMLKPMAIYGQEYRAQEDALSELATKSNIWEGMANEQSDPYAYKMYKKYADDLEMQAGQLAREGLSPTSRQGMLQMKQRYSKEITPIETAYKRREELAAEQRKALAQNPTLRYQRMARTMSLDDFIKNPSLDYGESYSGALLTQQVSEAATAFQKALTDKGKLKGLELPYQYERMLQYGATPAQVMAAMSQDAQQGDSEAVKFLRGITEQVLKSSGVADWADNATMEEFRAFANQGLYSAIGQTKIDNFTDQFSMQDALNARQHARQVATQKAAEERQRQERLKMYNINPTSLYGTSEVSAKNKATIDQLNKWRSKGYFNSKGQLTKAGMKALQGATWQSKYQRGSTGYTETKVKVGDWEFKNWALAHGQKQSDIDRGYGTVGKGGWQVLNAYYTTTMSKANSGQLVTGTPNIDVYRQSVRDKTTQEYLLNKTTAALAGGHIYQVGDLSVNSKGVTMSKGKGVSAADFRKLATDNPILYVINSPMTNNQLIELADGTKYIMPKGMIDNISQAQISDANVRLSNSGSMQESAVLLNQANSYLGTLLNYNEGTGVSTNDGTITF